MGDSKPEISVIIPVYNSAKIFQELHRRLTDVLERAADSHEVIAVVDGCMDDYVDTSKRPIIYFLGSVVMATRRFHSRTQ